MREIITHSETIEKEEVVALTCDCCGKVSDDENIWASDIETWKHEFGYGSKFDTSKWSFELCDNCIEKWTNTFVHSPQKN
jgi:hypothetical protein